MNGTNRMRPVEASSIVIPGSVSTPNFLATTPTLRILSLRKTPLTRPVFQLPTRVMEMLSNPGVSQTQKGYPCSSMLVIRSTTTLKPTHSVATWTASQMVASSIDTQEMAPLSNSENKTAAYMIH